MNIFNRLAETEPDFDEPTEKLTPPAFALAGMGQMVWLVSPVDGSEHWVRRHSTAYRFMRSHGYMVQEGKS